MVNFLCPLERVAGLLSHFTVYYTHSPRREGKAEDLLHFPAAPYSTSSMEMLSLLPLTFLLLVSFHPQAVADLKSDKKALLDFAAAVPHGSKLNWSSATRVCTSWLGITCNANGSRILAVRLPAVGLFGPIPSNTLGKLDALTTLSLRSNLLGGSLAPDILSLPTLQHVHLQHNNFSGPIPSSLSPQINTIDLSFNSFTGNIPSSMQNLTQLTSLSLQNNSLTGPIPQFNMSSGLKQLNLSYNHLNGSIPSSLQKFPTSSFEGNNKLCGPPLNQCSVALTPSPSPAPSPTQSPIVPSPLPAHHLPPPTLPQSKSEPGNGSKNKLSSGTIAAIAVVVGGCTIFMFLLLMVFGCLRRKRGRGSGRLKRKGGRNDKPKEDFGSGVQEAEKNRLVFFHGPSYNFDLEDLLRASAEVLGKGSCGTTYKAILEEGTTVAVKRVKEVAVGKREFEQQMEIIGSIPHHPNVLPLRAYYYSKDEKLLVSDYASAGNFSALLHGSKETGRAPLDWESRVKFSLGTARGIAHIHSSAGGGKFVHGNIKSSNVLLTQEQGEGLHARVSDFGLSPLISRPAVPSRSAGYKAPEVIETRKSTQKSDVYSFGILLLEMLTGKSPIQVPGHEDVIDLPRWVNSVVREEWTAEVFDVELMRYKNIEEEMVQMLQIAMACVASVPDTRPTMEDVVRMMEEMRPPSDENKGLNTWTP